MPSSSYGETIENSSYEQRETFTINGNSYPPNITTNTLPVYTHGRYGYSVNVRQHNLANIGTWIFPSSYDRWSSTLTHGSGSTRVVGNNYQTEYNGVYGYSDLYQAYRQLGDVDFPTPYSGVHSYSSNTFNRLNIECMLAIRDNKANISEALATARKTADQFIERSTQLFRALLDVKHGNFGRAASRFGLTSRKGLAQGYLEYKYGWKPLSQDIYGLGKLLSEQTRSGLLLHSKKSIHSENNYDIDGVLGKVRQSSSANYTTKLWAVISAEDIYLASRAGLINPVSLAWELVPWSFVLDWALPIGNVLSALETPLGMNFIGGYNSVKANGFTTVEQPAGGGNVIVDSPVISKIHHQSYRRFKLSAWPLPIPYYKSPFTQGNATSALALLAALRG